MSIKIAPINIAGFLIIVFSGFYLKNVMISPIYVTTVMAVIIILLLLVSQRMKAVTKRSLNCVLIYILYLILLQPAQVRNSAYYNLIFSLVYFILTFEIAVALSDKTLRRLCKRMLDISIVLLTVEAIYRVANPVIRAVNVGNISFYKFKYNSIMYQDSNFVATYILVLFFFAMYLERCQDFKLKFEKIALFVLCLFTISRSAILVIVGCAFFFNKSIKKSFKILSAFSVGFIVIYVVLQYVLQDGSFQSKLMIMQLAADFLKERASMSMILFGVGLGYTKEYLGIGSHNLLVTYIFETGIVGFLIWAMTWCTIFFDAHKKSYYIMIPILIVGFSFTQHFLPFLYCAFAIIIVMENRMVKDGKGEKNEEQHSVY